MANKPEPFKTVVVVRKDLDLPLGKWIAQAIHSTLRVEHGSLNMREFHYQYMNDDSYQPICVVCYVKSESELNKLRDKAWNAGLPCAVQVDAGHNFVQAGTPTCLTIGPAPESEVNKVTKRLQLLK